VLIVMSRGGIVDERALTDALQSNGLRGAALDVFEEEPLPASSPLWSAPNLVITPHIAGLTHDYIERVMRVALENIARVERGEPPSTPVDRARGY
jgi:phosphoglycerate dehydrogenase-like enzyme